MTSDTGTVAGTIVNAGVLETSGSLVFQDGAVYEHARDGGSVPTAIWEMGSTALLTGITSTAPANRGQDYYNLTLNTPGLISNLDMNLNDRTIGGDIRVVSSGAGTNRWRLVGGSSGTVTIMGDVIVEGGSLETQGTSSVTDVVVLHHGDVLVTGGTFAVSRGSQGGTGTTRWYLMEGYFSMSNATTRNSNPAGATFIFANQNGVQNLILSSVTYLGGGLPIQVDSAVTLNMDTTVVSGDGNFVLSAGATLETAHVDGVSGVLQTTGTITLSQEANFNFYGAATQVTSILMPDTLNNLIINNLDTVVLSQETLINGVLRLMAGVFDNSIPFTLGPTGEILYEGGTLLNPITSIENQTASIPDKFALFQNYPNPFNPATTIRYHVPEQAQVTITVYDIMGREVAELVNNYHVAGAYAVTWNALNYASGIYYYRMSAGNFVSVQKLVLMK